MTRFKTHGPRSTAALLFATVVALAFVPALAAQDASPIGDWEGTLSAPGAEIPLVLHVTEGENGLEATMDSPAQGAFGIAAAEVTFEEGALTIDFPDIAGSYEATLGEDGDSLTGTWSQGGQSLELDFTRSEG